MSQVLTVKIAAPAGLGIKSGGLLLDKILTAHGLNLKDYTEYPSLVRGGHNSFQVSFSPDPVFAVHFQVDLFFSLLGGHWQPHLTEFSKDTLVFGDEEFPELPGFGTFINLPLKQISLELNNQLVVNTICIGVIAYLYNLNRKIAQTCIQAQYGKYADVNLLAFDAGFTYAQNHLTQYAHHLSLPSKANPKSHLADGNESFGWGFIKGGGNFYAAYPMTPATGALHFLAEKQKEHNLNVYHPEDEIAVANMAAGAAFAGARSAVGTSGGGFVLMDETISFCGVTEIGMVYYLVSRPGPATGLPTWTGQGDLLHAINAGHGEFPKVVLAPGSQEESFEFSAEALNLAAILQTPVIVLSDKYLGESSSNVPDFSRQKFKVDHGLIEPKPAPSFYRYSLPAKNGISPRSIPGAPNGEFLANSYEHDQTGFATEDSTQATQMAKKRQAKLKYTQKLCPKYKLFGPKNAPNLIISWGSTAMPILESLPLLSGFSFLQIRTLWPLDPKIRLLISKYKKVYLFEANQTGQLTTLLKSQFAFSPNRQFLKYDGRPFYPEEIIGFLAKK